MKAVKIVSLALGFIFPALAIETVPVLDVEKYTGRWYQVCTTQRAGQLNFEVPDELLSFTS